MAYMKIKFLLLFCLFQGVLNAQESLQYFRPNNQDGINIFEPGKKDSSIYSGLRVKVGGNFTQDFQASTLR